MSGAGDQRSDAALIRCDVGHPKCDAEVLESEVADQKCGVALPMCGVGDLKSGVALRKCGVGDWKSGVGDLKSGVALRKCGAGDWKSGVGDPKSDVALRKCGAGAFSAADRGLALPHGSAGKNGSLQACCCASGTTAAPERFSRAGSRANLWAWTCGVDRERFLQTVFLKLPPPPRDASAEPCLSSNALLSVKATICVSRP